jgi:hypothetical protein
MIGFWKTAVGSQEMEMSRYQFRACLLSASLLLGAMHSGCDDDAAADAAGAAGSDGHASHGESDANAESDESGAMVGPATGATCPTDSALTYESFAKKFMSDYCLRCHSTAVSSAARMMAPGDHNFDTYADVDVFAAHIDQLAGSGPTATNTMMPPSAPFPSDEERKKLSEWIACNRPE